MRRKTAVPAPPATCRTGYVDWPAASAAPLRECGVGLTVSARLGTRRRPSRPSSTTEVFPVPFRDDFDVAVDHLDGGLVVDGIGRILKGCRPFLRAGHRVFREGRIVQVREDREVDDAERAVVPGDGRLGLDEVRTDPR